MIFISPNLLVALAGVPLLVTLYLWVLRRRRRALRYSSLALVRPALVKTTRVRQHLPPALFLLALASLAMALARPAIVQTFFNSQTTVILAIDVSGSMSSPDIPPSRLGAAQEAALFFVRSQKSSTRIGIVAFSNFANLIQPPTSDPNQLETAIRSLTLGDSTAIGRGILESLDAIARSSPPGVIPVTGGDAAPSPVPSLAPRDPAAKDAHAPEIIVLLTDGENNSGPLPTDAARVAASRGVRVYTIGYGPDFANRDPKSAPPDPKAQNPDAGVTNSNQGGMNAFLLNYDRQTLNNVAEMTGGKSYTAANASQLRQVFASLPIQKTAQTEKVEISVAFIGLGALLLVAALVLSSLWRPLP